MTRPATVTTTVSQQFRGLDVDAICAFADTLRAKGVRGSAPVQIQVHEGQRGQTEGVTMTALVVE